MQTEIEHLRPPELVRLSHWEDRHEVRVANWIKPWDFVEPIDVGITAVPIARAAIKPVSAHQGPNALRDGRFFFTTYSIDYDVEIRDLVVRDTGDVDIPLWDVVEAHERIYAAARALLAHEPRFFPVFVGGDHSMTRPIVRALHAARPELERLGLIQFDAHIDCQNFDDGGPHNGTPIRGIIEDENGVEPRNVVQIGISGFVNADYYRRYLVDEQGGTIFSTREVARRGIEAVLTEAWAIASRGVDGVYVTFDIDSLELACAPGTGAAVSGGLTPWQAMDALFELGGREEVVGFDLVEVDPSRDPQGITQRLANKLLLTFLAGLRTRSGVGPAESVRGEAP
jgi:formiminoglutamase